MQRRGDIVAGNQARRALAHGLFRIANGHQPLGPGLLHSLVQRGLDLTAINRVADLELRRNSPQRLVRRPPGGCHRRQPVRSLHQLHAGGPVLINRAQRHAFAHRPMADRGIDHAVQPHVARKSGRALRQGRQVNPGPGRARIARGFGRRRTQLRISGQVMLRGVLGQVAEPGALVAMDHETIRRLALAPVDIPAARRSPAQQFPRPCRRMAHRLLVGGKRGAPRRRHESVALGKAPDQPAVLALGEPRRERHPQPRPVRRQRRVGIGAADRRGHCGDLAPVGPQFHRRNLREERGDALPHFQLRHGDGDDPGLRYRQPQPESEFAFSERQFQRKSARRQRPGDEQASARRAADQQAATRQAHLSPAAPAKSPASARWP